ncbi:hypothetical protein [Streptomyces oceani]|uniref:Integral membrane protein n=1 Tax=Streptomyces oceani TaxID=1075402 RepID=A0A1E7JWC9_9ACTN|nr:hypothetical protein [Streptomyces oceani]OEU95957.1 hypothetical protein AN216_22735 [Streptomyces oceani]
METTPGAPVKPLPIPTALRAPLRERPLLERMFVRLVGLGLSVVAYLLCLPWDLRNRPESPGSIDETTPVETGGVLTLAVVLLLLAAYFGYRDRLLWPLPLVALPPVVLLFVSFSSHPAPDASAWPIAWIFFSMLIFGGVLMVATMARRAAKRAAGQP